jgi:hypothetical protein
MSTAEQQAILKKRNMKAQAHLEQFAPVWLVAEQVIAEDDAVQFNVVFQHNLYGWVNRRYRYDAFNDTLYHKGQFQIGEEQALELTLGEPFISTMVSDTPNAIGG